MSRSGNWYIAATQGPQFTLYAAMKAFGIPLTEEQEKCQEYLERKYGEKELMHEQRPDAENGV